MAETYDPVPVGALVVDCSTMQPFMVDRPRGERSRLRTTQEGFREAVLEVMSNQANWGNIAGITPEELATLEERNAQVARIDEVLPAARKLVELLEESRSVHDDSRHRQIFEIASVVEARSKARRTDELLAKYEKTRAYRSATAIKAARTRRRNAAQVDSPTEPDLLPEVPTADIGDVTTA